MKIKLLSWSASAALLIGTLVRADVVTDWNNAALDAIRAGSTAPPIASRSLAILHVSIYDAVNGIARTHEPRKQPDGSGLSHNHPSSGSFGLTLRPKVDGVPTVRAIEAL